MTSEHARVDARLLGATLAGRVAAGLSRRVGAGRGDTVGGLVVERLDPSALRKLADGRRVVLVTGTNGKSTTTRLCAAALGDAAATNRGSNLPRGLTWALAADRSPLAVLEVDELHLPRVMEATRPVAVAALNLSRDQLDRINEVRRIAQRWSEAFAASDAVVIANAADPLVVDAARHARSQTWVLAPTTWHDDAEVCPVCHGVISQGPDGWCSACGFAQPVPDVWFDDAALHVRDAGTVPLELALPGAVNRGNAAFAVAVATLLGISLENACQRIAGVRSVDGRYADITLSGRPARLLLAKNPAGWAAALEALRGGAQLAFGINARTADGTDPSWLWDVPFEKLSGATIGAFGDRASDLAVRLRYAGVEPVLATSASDAARRLPGGTLDVVANYTAFAEIARDHAG